MTSHSIIIGFFNSDQYIRLWDTSSNQLIMKLKAFSSPILGIRYILPLAECATNPRQWCAQPLLLLWSEKTEIKLYNVSTMTVVASIDYLRSLTAHFSISSISTSLYKSKHIVICVVNDSRFLCIKANSENAAFPKMILDSSFNSDSQVLASTITSLTFDIVYITPAGIYRAPSSNAWQSIDLFPT